jgi:hypothetical protein
MQEWDLRVRAVVGSRVAGTNNFVRQYGPGTGGLDRMNHDPHPLYLKRENGVIEA